MKGVFIAVALLCLVVLVAYWAGGREDRLRETININETEGRINEAITDNHDCDWRQRLLNTCP